jgi:uncharacterized membrane protein
MTTTAPHTYPTADTRPTFKEVLDRILEIVGFVFVAGPPVLFVAVPWLLVVLLLTPWLAAMVALVVVVLAAGALLAAAGAIVASPYLVVRHVRAHRAAAEAPVAEAPVAEAPVAEAPVAMPAPRLVPRRSAA